MNTRQLARLRLYLLVYLVMTGLSSHVISRFVDYGSVLPHGTAAQSYSPHQKHQDLRKDFQQWNALLALQAGLPLPESSPAPDPIELSQTRLLLDQDQFIRPPPSC